MSVVRVRSLTPYKAQGKALRVVHVLSRASPYVPWSRVTRFDHLLIVSASPITVGFLNAPPTPAVCAIQQYMASRVAMQRRTVEMSRALMDG